MMRSIVIICGLLLVRSASAAMAEISQTEAVGQQVHQQEQQRTMQQRSDDSDVDTSATLSGSSPSNAENVIQFTRYAPPCPRPLPKGYVFFEGEGLGYYKLYTVPTNWYNAIASCEREGGYLSVFGSKEEVEVVVKLLTDLDIKKSVNEVFADFHELFDEGKFITTIGYNFWSKAEWDTGYPNGRDDSHCGAVGINGKFRDVSCEARRFFVCEMPNVY